ncbi:MAG: DUF4276 family protein [Bacteroidia bacterium]
MKRIYVIVEGLSEMEFVKRVMEPYFTAKRIIISGIPMKKSGGGSGFSNLDHFKNNVTPLLFESDQPVITTMIDLYKFPVQSGNPHEERLLKHYDKVSNINEKLAGLEKVLSAVVDKIKPYPEFLPYIQKHEFEALLFSDPDVFNIEDPNIVSDIAAILIDNPNPEDINTTFDGHPARRLETIFAKHKKKYVKGADAVDFAEIAGIEKIMEKCPRFKTWILDLVSMAISPTM